MEKQISPADCKINFAVPSDLILAKHSGSIVDILYRRSLVYTLLVNSCNRPARRSIRTRYLPLAQEPY